MTGVPFCFGFKNLRLDILCVDSFCLYITILIVKWRHLVVTFSVGEFSSISLIKSFLLHSNVLAYLKLDSNLSYMTASNYLVRSKLFCC